MLVMAYPRNETGIKYQENKFDDVKVYNKSVEWHIEGDRLEVWYDTEKYDEVVYRRFGGVLCMYERFDTYVRNDCDDQVEIQIAKILKDEALGNGYPEECPKSELNEYAVTLRRTIRISVMAQDPEQAQRIGENLADGSGEFGCQVVNDAMCNGDDEFYGVGPADSAFYHKKLGEEDSMRVLNEEE